jgi:hypothetical protein
VAELLDLARDILDELVVDEHNREFGRIDGILLHLRHGKPPRVGEIEVGAYTVLRRVNRPLGEWLAAVLERVSPVSLKSARLPFEHFKRRGGRIQMSVDAEADTRLLPGEKWLREHIVKALPGGHK